MSTGWRRRRAITDDPSLGAVRVLILTTFELDEYVFEALRAGAAGFLVKHTEPAELVRAVRVVAAGEALLSPSVTRRLIAEFASRPSRGDAPSGALAGLTDREREVMILVGQGLSNDEIAAEWVVSPATVRTHVSRAMMKLHARDRAQLVVDGLPARPGTHELMARFARWVGQGRPDRTCSLRHERSGTALHV